MPAEDGSTPASATETPSPHSKSGARRGRRRWLLPTAAVVVVAAVIVAGLFAAGVVHWGASSPPTSPYLTFSQAGSSAQGSSTSVPGGPWYVVAGAAVSTPVAILEPTSNVSSLLTESNCTFYWPGGELANIGVPATPPTAATGAVAFWAIGLKNASNGILLETVSDGSASVLVTASGGDCARAAGYLESFPAGSVDSPTVVTAVNRIGGTAFLSAHPNSTQLWGAVGGVSLGVLGATTPEWYVEYTSCSFPGAIGETGAFINATVAGLTGEVISNHTGNTSCSLTLPSSITTVVPGAAAPVALRKAI
jgi:hypothetical protein